MKDPQFFAALAKQLLDEVNNGPDGQDLRISPELAVVIAEKIKREILFSDPPPSAPPPLEMPAPRYTGSPWMEENYGTEISRHRHRRAA